MSATQFYLVRHGQTVWNTQGRIQGHQDSPLTPQGIADAEDVAARLRGETFAAVYTSDLLRAYRTARCIAEAAGVDVIDDVRLRETKIGLFEGKTREEAQTEHPEIFAQYARRMPDYALPGGESRQSVQDRAVSFFTEKAVQHPGGRFVAVSHGGLLSAFVCAILGLPLSGSRTFWLANGGLSLVTYLAENGGAWQIETLNETQYLRIRDG